MGAAEDTEAAAKSSRDTARGAALALSARHLRFGWWALAAFLGMGLALEALHAVKLGWYLDVSNETRRLMFTLAHTHGTLMAIVNLCFAFTLRSGALAVDSRITLASRAFLVGSLLMPLGFLLGGITVYGGDPGIPVVISPIGGLLLLFAVVTTASRLRRFPS